MYMVPSLSLGRWSLIQVPLKFPRKKKALTKVS